MFSLAYLLPFFLWLPCLLTPSLLLPSLAPSISLPYLLICFLPCTSSSLLCTSSSVPLPTSLTYFLPSFYLFCPNASSSLLLLSLSLSLTHLLTDLIVSPSFTLPLPPLLTYLFPYSSTYSLPPSLSFLSLYLFLPYWLTHLLTRLTTPSLSILSLLTSSLCFYFPSSLPLLPALITYSPTIFFSRTHLLFPSAVLTYSLPLSHYLTYSLPLLPLPTHSLLLLLSSLLCSAFYLPFLLIHLCAYLLPPCLTHWFSLFYLFFPLSPTLLLTHFLSLSYSLTHFFLRSLSPNFFLPYLLNHFLPSTSFSLPLLHPSLSYLTYSLTSSLLLCFHFHFFLPSTSSPLSHLTNCSLTSSLIYSSTLLPSLSFTFSVLL